MSSYQNTFNQSVSDPAAFWLEQSTQIEWFTPPQTAIHKDENGIERWFPDGELNTSYLALDFHVQNGRGDQTALIYDSPVTGKKSTVQLSCIARSSRKMCRYALCTWRNQRG
ncbi:Acetyl-coenzyme A synthetase N-terminus [Enterovibrio nigricans DSM 22720]|uniref:Acetyl-coenzyme A synthetase N-terminus n=1 Tax=Enterovibrio nigricans DSM 22720 TaxID=1121868 RepID=A0A1T4UGC8_9GAMM|nr:Acetyl-coenzyme A synthetase N-terminus [Enterovibrio nigricans DSM 22720]